MNELRMDGSRVQVPGSLSWGQLLGALEREHLTEGHIIRSVAFDGEELEDFRDSIVEETDVDALERVDVITVDVTEYVRELVEESTRHLDGVIRVLADSIAYYRQDLPSEGAERLHGAFRGLDTLMQIVSMVNAMAGWDLNDFDLGERSTQEELNQLETVLTEVIHCQESEDTTGLADIVESRLIPSLNPWVRIIGEIQSRLVACNT